MLLVSVVGAQETITFEVMLECFFSYELFSLPSVMHRLMHCSAQQLNLLLHEIALSSLDATGIKTVPGYHLCPTDVQ